MRQPIESVIEATTATMEPAASNGALHAGNTAARISVVIPTYNCERYIGQTLQSVLSQSLQPVEVIVVDDGSTDQTAQRAMAAGPAVRVIRQANQGVCAARNRGFGESTGEFVAFLDHDDYWFPGKLQRQALAFRRRPEAGVVYTDFLNWLPNDGQFPEPASLAREAAGDLAFNESYSGWIYHQLLITCWPLTSTALLRRDVFQDAGGFNRHLPYAEDWDLWLRISRQAPFLKLNEVSTLYRQHGDQGNRMVRSIDYRTQLLEQAAGRWGLASQDGRAVERRMFHARLARYHMEFALNHLARGHRGVAFRSLLKACRHDLAKPKYMAMLAAACLGWRPGLQQLSR